jgi:FlaA1/EpsC-like NDP-sugar epimerase
MPKKIFNIILKNSSLRRRAFFLFFDALFISFSIYASFWLRYYLDYGERFPEGAATPLFYYILLALVIKLFFLIIFNLYDISWRFIGLQEIIRIFYALSIGSMFFAMIIFVLRVYSPFRDILPFPRSAILIDFIICSFLITSLRVSKRIFIEGIKSPFRQKEERIRVLIYGAGGAGEQIVRQMQRNKASNYMPVGFIDDNPSKSGINIHGVKVLGKREDIHSVIKANKVDEVLVALPSAHSNDIKEIVALIRNSDLIKDIKILPNVTDLINGNVTLSDIHEVELEDLLGREPVKVDFKAIENFIQGKKVLITGAGGSIGSELAKTILQFDPQKLIVFDIDETEIFHLVNHLKSRKVEIIPVIGDIKDQEKIESILKDLSPQIILHSAAYKHVPVLEMYPEEAVKTNVLGTKVLAEASIQYKIEKFIFISTDKAINPTSVMGATKRAGEELIKAFNQKNETKFISVRFGNVLGSRGSVIPLFKEQLKKGGPLTVTHPEMERYFMSTSEAVLLVLEASAIGQGGEVFVLDMGEPIKILDLAKEMIRLSGYEPDVDIPIVFTEIRPGEKLYEEILSAEEGVNPTEYDKILMARSSNQRSSDLIMEKTARLIQISHQNNKEEIIKILKELVPTYSPQSIYPERDIEL